MLNPAKYVQTDNQEADDFDFRRGSDYSNHKFKLVLMQNQIEREITEPKSGESTPQDNLFLRGPSYRGE